VRSVSLLAAAGFALVTAGAVAVRPTSNEFRRYRWIVAVIFGASAVSYAGIGLGYGRVDLATGSVAWLHYAEWLVGTPAYVAGLFLLTEEPNTVRLAVGLDLLMVGAGIGAALTSEPARYALFALATLSLVGLFALLVGRQGAGGWRSALYTDLRRLFLAVGPGYPVVWLLGSEGLGLFGFGVTKLGFLLLDAVVKAGFLVLLCRAQPVDIILPVWDG
jgi:bacteriorhodopsin